RDVKPHPGRFRETSASKPNAFRQNDSVPDRACAPLAPPKAQRSPPGVQIPPNVRDAARDNLRIEPLPHHRRHRVLAARRALRFVGTPTRRSGSHGGGSQNSDPRWPHSTVVPFLRCALGAEEPDGECKERQRDGLLAPSLFHSCSWKRISLPALPVP